MRNNPIGAVQRSISFKRPQELYESNYVHKFVRQNSRSSGNNVHTSKSANQPIDIVEQMSSCARNMPMSSNSSSQEHIYDNSELFKRSKTNDISSSILLTTDKSTIQTRGYTSSSAVRLRPMTMHGSGETDKNAINEFEHVSNRLKARASVRTNEIKQDNVSTIISEWTPSSTSVSVSMNKQVVQPMTRQYPVSSTLLLLNRRKTLDDGRLSTEIKPSHIDMKVTPSWIDIAKQKQTKL
jgi:hypothetical protein